MSRQFTKMNSEKYQGTTVSKDVFSKVAVIKPIKCQCCPHIETSQLICYAKSIDCICMRAILAFNGLSQDFSDVLSTTI